MRVVSTSQADSSYECAALIRGVRLHPALRLVLCRGEFGIEEKIAFEAGTVGKGGTAGQAETLPSAEMFAVGRHALGHTCQGSMPLFVEILQNARIFQ